MSTPPGEAVTPSRPSDAATRLSPASPAPRASPDQLVPGTVLAGRYRVVMMLGRGGMGEVYRADDLLLDQPVALKFLPADVTIDHTRLAQFHGELRIARQVSHKNVCRLYDLGEFEGRRFLTMQYVDGEDLASLLRRIGRVPQDKALQIARQLCAGLAAAHERGVIHRDLKPANVIIDGEGHAVIADFGIATPASAVAACMAGTPQYMAPEQLSGQPASVQSDIYALGLLLFELFTGHRVHEAKDISALKRAHESGSAPTPSSLLPDIDPIVERVVLQCLDRDASRRPASALTVAAALPGGDPLALALAAGETPSPEVVAAAGQVDALPRFYAVVATLWLVIGLLVAVLLAPRATEVRLVPFDLPPPVLADRAEQVLASIGYGGARGDVAYDFAQPRDYEYWIRRADRGPDRWRVLSTGVPVATEFWYRASDRPLVSQHGHLNPAYDDPPLLYSGDYKLRLDTRGLLQQFHTIAPSASQPAPGLAAPSWGVLFAAAGLSIDAFQPDVPENTPASFADARVAWMGHAPNRPDVPIRIEAASLAGRPISFAVKWPWTPATTGPVARSVADRRGLAGMWALIIGVMISAVVLARAHVRGARADTRGATRLAVFVLGVELVRWLFASHVADITLEMGTLQRSLETATLHAAISWVLYTALEPYARRYWPSILLGWSRLLSGHLRDTRVGRDVTIGVALGVVWLLLKTARFLLPQALGYPAMPPRLGWGLSALAGPGATIALWSSLILEQLLAVLGFAFLFVALRRVTRYSWIAIPLGASVIFVFWSAFALSDAHGIELAVELATVGLFVLVLIRFGVLPAVVAAVVSQLLSALPLTLDFSHWSATPSNWTLAAVIALGLWGVYAALGIRSPTRRS